MQVYSYREGKNIFRHFCSDMHKQMKTVLTENIQRLKKMEFQRTTEGERERTFLGYVETLVDEEEEKEREREMIQRVREYELENGERLAKWERWGRESRETEECFFVCGRDTWRENIGGGASNGKSKRQKWECLGVQSPVLTSSFMGKEFRSRTIG